MFVPVCVKRRISTGQCDSGVNCAINRRTRGLCYHLSRSVFFSFIIIIPFAVLGINVCYYVRCAWEPFTIPSRSARFDTSSSFIFSTYGFAAATRLYDSFLQSRVCFLFAITDDDDGSIGFR